MKTLMMELVLGQSSLEGLWWGKNKLFSEDIRKGFIAEGTLAEALEDK